MIGPVLTALALSLVVSPPAFPGGGTYFTNVTADAGLTGVQGLRVFVDRTAGSGVRDNRTGTTTGRHSDAAIFGDVDNDGDLDTFTNVYLHRNDGLGLGTNDLPINDGTAHFTLSSNRDSLPDPSGCGGPHADDVTDGDAGTPGIQHRDAGAASTGTVLHDLVTAENVCGETALR